MTSRETPKETAYLLDLSESTPVKRHSRKVLIAGCVGTLLIGTFVIWRSNQISATASIKSAALAASKAPDFVQAWETCYPGGLGCEYGYNCCVGPADVVRGAPFSSNKHTCRDFNSCTPPQSNQVIKGWETCYAGSQCEQGYVCCLGSGDVSSGKLTCRLDGRPAYDFAGCVPGNSQPSNIVSPWADCKDQSNCEGFFTCCVAPSDLGSGKKTCRQSGLPENHPSGCVGSNPSAIFAPPPPPPPPTNWNPDMPSGFRGLNSGIGSYFSASLSSDSTNGRSWCGFPYKDYSNGFAPDLSVMTDGTNAVWTGYENNYASSARKYCGLEARVTNTATGASKIMYIIDAFDPRWVRTPGSIDIMSKSWEELAGRPANDKNVVIPVTWELTGNRNQKYTFEGVGDP